MANNARDEPSHVSQYSLGLRDIRVRAFHSLATRSEKILNDGFRESTHKSYRLGFDVLRTSDQKVFSFYFILLYTYILLLYIATKFIRFRYYSVFFEYKTFELRDAIPFSLPVLMSFFTPNFFTAVKLWLLIIVVASFTFSIIGFNAAHHHPDIFHDGDIYRFVYIETNFVFSILFDIIFLKKERIVYLASKSKDRPSFFFFRDDYDWGVLELDAVRERKVIDDSDFLVLTNFGLHGLHHLLPTVDHSYLPLCVNAFEQTCKEFGISTEKFSQWEFIKGQFKQLARKEPKKNFR